MAVAAADWHRLRFNGPSVDRHELRTERRRRIVVGRDNPARDATASTHDQHVVHVFRANRHASLSELAFGAGITSRAHNDVVRTGREAVDLERAIGAGHAVAEAHHAHHRRPVDEIRHYEALHLWFAA